MPRRYTIVRIVLGVLLLAAAVLKLYGLSVSAVPRVGWFAQPWVQLAAVEWEAVLGLWLLIGAHPRGSWFAAVGTFLAFAGLSGYLGWVGVASCGCFGAIQASPWLAFAVDVTALALLTARPGIPEVARSNSPITRTVIHGVALAAILGGVTVGVLVGWQGSLRAALALIRGERVGVNPGYLDLGDGTPGETLEAVVEVANWTDHPVRLVGGTSDCSCVATDGLPVTIPARGREEVRVAVTIPPRSPGRTTRAVQLWTDVPEQSVLRFTLGYRTAGD